MLLLKSFLSPKHTAQFSSQMKDWHREAIVTISDWPRLFHDANLSSGTADNRAGCLGLYEIAVN